MKLSIKLQMMKKYVSASNKKGFQLVEVLFSKLIFLFA